MSWLFIESVNHDACTIGLLGADIKLWRSKGRSHIVLNQICRHVSSAMFVRLDGICVVSGPGSFSSTRTGVLIANLLARQYKLPLIGVTVDETRDMEQLRLKLKAQRTKFADRRIKIEVGYVAPIYSSEPNITMPKKKLEVRI